MEQVDMIAVLVKEIQRRGWADPVVDDDTAVWSWENGDTHIKHAVEVRWLGSGFRISGRANLYSNAHETADAIMDELNRHYEPGLLAQFRMKREWAAYGNPLVPINKTFSVNEYGDILRQHGIW